MMSRKHYKAVGQILADNNATDDTIKDFCYMFVGDNSRFNSTTFKNFIDDKKQDREHSVFVGVVKKIEGVQNE